MSYLHLQSFKNQVALLQLKQAQVFSLLQQEGWEFASAVREGGE